jgi:hypothetical protein
MLMDLKCVGFVIQLADQGLMQGWQDRARDVDHRAIHLGDGAYLCEIFDCRFHG